MIRPRKSKKERYSCMRHDTSSQYCKEELWVSSPSFRKGESIGKSISLLINYIIQKRNKGFLEKWEFKSTTKFVLILSEIQGLGVTKLADHCYYFMDGWTVVAQHWFSYLKFIDNDSNMHSYSLSIYF